MGRLTVTEDTPADMLSGNMELLVQLPPRINDGVDDSERDRDLDLDLDLTDSDNDDEVQEAVASAAEEERDEDQARKEDDDVKHNRKQQYHHLRRRRRGHHRHHRAKDIRAHHEQQRDTTGNDTRWVTVARSTPMMDLLVQVATAQKLSASRYTLEAIGEHGIVLAHHPNTPIGALDVLQVKLLPKQGSFMPRKSRQANQPFEPTFRLQVHLPRNQLYVSRVSSRMNLGKILEDVCREKNLDRNKYELRHPANIEEILDLALSLQDYHLQEVTLCSKQRSLGSGLSTQDIMALQRQEERRRREAKQGVFGFIFRKSKEPRSLSTDSLGERSVSPARSDETGRSASPQIPVPPARPLRKRRPAPNPPMAVNRDHRAPETDAAEEKLVVGVTSSGVGDRRGHSRNSSDSSGYHEASVLSDNIDSNARVPETLPRRRRPVPAVNNAAATTAVSTPATDIGFGSDGAADPAADNIAAAPRTMRVEPPRRNLAESSRTSHSLVNLSILSVNGGGGTLSHATSSSSLSSTGPRKKKSAPPPPPQRQSGLQFSDISTRILELDASSSVDPGIADGHHFVSIATSTSKRNEDGGSSKTPGGRVGGDETSVEDESRVETREQAKADRGETRRENTTKEPKEERRGEPRSEAGEQSAEVEIGKEPDENPIAEIYGMPEGYSRAQREEKPKGEHDEEEQRQKARWVPGDESKGKSKVKRREGYVGEPREEPRSNPGDESNDKPKQHLAERRPDDDDDYDDDDDDDDDDHDRAERSTDPMTDPNPRIIVVPDNVEPFAISRVKARLAAVSIPPSPKVRTNDETYNAEAAILAFRKSPRRTPIEQPEREQRSLSAKSTAELDESALIGTTTTTTTTTTHVAGENLDDIWKISGGIGRGMRRSCAVVSTIPKCHNFYFPRWILNAETGKNQSGSGSRGKLDNSKFGVKFDGDKSIERWKRRKWRLAKKQSETFVPTMDFESDDGVINNGNGDEDEDDDDDDEDEDDNDGGGEDGFEEARNRETFSQPTDRGKYSRDKIKGVERTRSVMRGEMRRIPYLLRSHSELNGCEIGNSFARKNKRQLTLHPIDLCFAWNTNLAELRRTRTIAIVSARGTDRAVKSTGGPSPGSASIGITTNRDPRSHATRIAEYFISGVDATQPRDRNRLQSSESDDAGKASPNARICWESDSLTMQRQEEPYPRSSLSSASVVAPGMVGSQQKTSVEDRRHVSTARELRDSSTSSSSSLFSNEQSSRPLATPRNWETATTTTTTTQATGETAVNRTVASNKLAARGPLGIGSHGNESRRSSSAMTSTPWVSPVDSTLANFTIATYAEQGTVPPTIERIETVALLARRVSAFEGDRGEAERSSKSATPERRGTGIEEAPGKPKIESQANDPNGDQSQSSFSVGTDREDSPNQRRLGVTRRRQLTSAEMRQETFVSVPKGVLPEPSGDDRPSNDYDIESAKSPDDDVAVEKRTSRPVLNERVDAKLTSAGLENGDVERLNATRAEHSVTAKRYSYAGPPAVDVGSWSERPRTILNVDPVVPLVQRRGDNEGNKGKSDDTSVPVATKSFSESSEHRGKDDKPGINTTTTTREETNDAGPSAKYRTVASVPRKETTVSEDRGKKSMPTSFAAATKVERENNDERGTRVEATRVSGHGEDVDSRSINFSESKKAFGGSPSPIVARPLKSAKTTIGSLANDVHAAVSGQPRDARVIASRHVGGVTGSKIPEVIGGNVATTIDPADSFARPKSNFGGLLWTGNASASAARVPIMPVVKGFKLPVDAPPRIEPARNDSDRRKVDEIGGDAANKRRSDRVAIGDISNANWTRRNASQPPTMPIITGVTLKSSSLPRPKSMPVAVELDSRGQLLESIRKFEGAGRLRSTTQSHWQ